MQLAPRTFIRKLVGNLSLAWLVASGSGVAHAEYRYSLTDLSSFAFAPGVSYGVAINDAGQVAGSIFDDLGRPAAFLYTPGSGMLDLGLYPPAGSSERVYADAVALNNAGQVTGSWQHGAYSTPYLYSAGTGMVDLGGLSPGPFQSAGGRSVNDAGTVLGYSYDTTQSAYRTFLYDATLGMRDIGTHLTGDGGAINNAGTVAGTNSANTHATTYDSNGLHDLGTLGGISSYAKAINEMGWVVGYSDVVQPGSNSSHAFLYDPLTGMIDLHTAGGLPWEYFSFATSMNDSGQVAGFYRETSEGEERAFIYDSASGIVDLNTLVDPATAQGWQLLSAFDINNAGQIVGYGLLNGNPRGFLLEALPAVPEPATWMLMVFGLGGVGVWKRLRSA